MSARQHATTAATALALTLWSQPLAPSPPEGLVVWNVGQGQWITLAIGQTCHHFDMGGEHADWRKLRALCLGRKNFVSFSHWDWDHVGLARRASRVLGNLCVLNEPGGVPPTQRRWRSLAALPRCSGSRSEFGPITSPEPRKLNSNATSRVFVVAGSVLTPGDSTTVEERAWSLKIHPHDRIQWLVLGHHGSRTSTSEELLRRLPHLRGAIASQRRARYGHPHPIVTKRLKRHGIAALTTEDWGHIRLELANLNRHAERLVELKPNFKRPSFQKQIPGRPIWSAPGTRNHRKPGKQKASRVLNS